jgi:hypothetical protein
MGMSPPFASIRASRSRGVVGITNLAIAGEEFIEKSAVLLLLFPQLRTLLSAEAGESLLPRLKFGAGSGGGKPLFNGMSSRSPV